MITHRGPDPNQDHALNAHELWGTATNGSPCACEPAVLPARRPDDSELLYGLCVAAVRLATARLEFRYDAERIATCTACGEETPGVTTFRHKSGCDADKILSTVELLRQRGTLT
jgi:hypothetical protein